MDKRMRELAAMGAAAANCHPCMGYHLVQCDKLSIDRDEITEADKVGLMVRRGAEKSIRNKVCDLFGEAVAKN